MGIRHYLIREYKDKGVTYNYSVNAQQHQGITSLLIKGIYNVEQQLLKEKGTCICVDIKALGVGGVESAMWMRSFFHLLLHMNYADNFLVLKEPFAYILQCTDISCSVSFESRAVNVAHTWSFRCYVILVPKTMLWNSVSSCVLIDAY